MTSAFQNNEITLFRWKSRTGFNRDYHAETPDGGQLPVLNVFSRNQNGIHHHWTSEMTFKRGDTSSLDPVWPIYGALDLTREGRGDSAAYPNLQY
jgi:predicted dithiol-disulfide oxidoreductase (DUF899 family)